MEMNTNVYICEPIFHTNTPNGKPNTIKTRPQSVRRRCRSECLQMISIHGSQTTTGTGFAIDQPNHHHPPTVDDRKIHNKTANNCRMAVNKYVNGYSNGGSIVNNSKEHTKENVQLGAVPEGNGDILGSGYKLEMEKYKEKQLNCNLATKGKKSAALNRKYTSEIDRLAEVNKRRARTRSESEPHEIYNTKYPMMSTEDINLKRPRDDSNPSLLTNGTFSHHENGFEVQANPSTPVVLLNSNHARLANGVTKDDATLPDENQSQLTLVKNRPWTRSKRSPTPTFKPKSAASRISTSVRSKPSKQNISPPAQELSAGKEATSQAESATVESCESDAECSSLEDDDDFGGGDGDKIEVEISDDEEIIRPLLTVDETGATILNTSASIAECITGGSVKSAPLAPSLFPNCPPYISFASHMERGPVVPPAIQKILKWKLTPITPIVVRRVLVNSGFKLLKKTNDWMGTWGKHMKSPCFKTIRSYQKINHIPGTFQIGRKDRVWRNLQTQMVRHGKKEFNFMPRSYVIPHDLKLLRQAWPIYQQKNTKWIIKPPASARGTGIRVVNRWSQIPKKKPLVIQKYIERPLLINGSKFDLRLYILVTSINPIRIYMHTDGLARFASVKYSAKSETLNDRYMHLTNYSINKLSSNYDKNEDAEACKGHKWTVKSLWTYLAGQGINTTLLWGAMRNLVLRTVLAAEGPIYSLTKMNTNSRYNCYELFGIDVILDSELIPWLLEVNISPSLHSASPLDMAVKGPLVTALMNTVLYQVPPKLTNVEQIDLLNELNMHDVDQLCYDRRIFSTQLTEAERVKHNHFANRNMICRDEYLQPILDNLTPDDVRCLIITEDELARCFPLERIFPAPNSHKYLPFTDNPRYYNRLLDAWETRYAHKRQEGIELLRSMCEMEVHLQVPPQSLRKTPAIMTKSRRKMEMQKRKRYLRMILMKRYQQRLALRRELCQRII